MQGAQGPNCRSDRHVVCLRSEPAAAAPPPPLSRRPHTAPTPPGTPMPRPAPPRSLAPAAKVNQTVCLRFGCLAVLRGTLVYSCTQSHGLLVKRAYKHMQCLLYEVQEGARRANNNRSPQAGEMALPGIKSPDKTPSFQQLLFSQTICGGGI